jgi:hypothetical protein
MNIEGNEREYWREIRSSKENKPCLREGRIFLSRTVMLVADWCLNFHGLRSFELLAAGEGVGVIHYNCGRTARSAFGILV